MLNVVFTDMDKTDAKTEIKQLGKLPESFRPQNSLKADKKVDLLQLASKSSESRVKFGDLLSRSKSKQQASSMLLKEKSSQVDVIWSNNSKHKIAKPSAFALLITTNSNDNLSDKFKNQLNI